MSSPKASSRAFSPPTQASEFEPAGGFQDVSEGGNVFLDAVFASKALENEHNPPAPKPLAQGDRKFGAANKDRARNRSPHDALRTPRKPAVESNLNAPPSVWSGGRTPDRFIGSRDNDVSAAFPSSSRLEDPDPDDEPLFDAPRSKGLLRSGARNSKHIPKQANKVMTPAEFEQYKNQRVTGPRDDDNGSVKSSDSEPYEDDDEAERTKQAAKYRRKQEAHLTVYRQQMMKATGEQPGLPTLPHKGGERLTMSTSNLPAFSFDRNETPTKSSTDDEDDDVPLGVLQAHGFPHKSRPPTRGASGGSSASLHRPETIAAYPSPGGTTRNDVAAGGGGSLPAFARNLPSDPYYGASLVRGTPREQLNFSNNGQMQQPPPSNLPPGGLVGVIAGEERAKALRRGSPNTRGTYESPNTQNAMGMAGGNMMGNPHMQPHQMHAMAQMNQSQADLQQTVSQIAQLQAQFMSMYMNGQGPQQPGMAPNFQNQMAQMAQLGQLGQMPQMQQGQMSQMNPQLPPFNQQNGFLSPGNNMFRPTSMASESSSIGHNRESAGSRSPMGQRTSTGLTMPESSAQSMYNMQPPAGYTPSIAPSERSNVGQPSRYRPLTFNANNENSRTSSMSQQTVQQTSQGPGARQDRAKSMGQRPASANALRSSTATPPVPSTIRAVNRPKHGGQDDDDDEEAFAALARKRQERQSKYKSKQPAAPGSGGQPFAQEGGMEGLFYEGPIH